MLPILIIQILLSFKNIQPFPFYQPQDREFEPLSKEGTQGPSPLQIKLSSMQATAMIWIFPMKTVSPYYFSCGRVWGFLLTHNMEVIALLPQALLT